MKKLSNLVFKSAFTLSVLSGGFMYASQANAAVISGDTTGIDTFNTADFYSVFFDTGNSSEFVSSITYNLDSSSVFDFSGSGSFNNSTAPVLSSLVGLNASDVSFDFSGNKTPSLTFNFAPMSFGVGDSFRFAADTDRASTAIDPSLTTKRGGDFGDNGVSFTVTLENGLSATSTFTNVNANRSVVSTQVPEPMTILGTGLALGLGTLMKRKKASA